MRDVSLYIPCYNVAPFIERCIEGVLRQSRPVAEILVIDDGSSDHTLALASRYPQVRVVQHEQNRGLAAARNTAFREACYDLVAALDADCIAAPDWLERLLPLLADPQVAGVGGRLVETVLLTTADRWRKAHMSQDWGDKQLINPRFMYGNNTIWRREKVLKAGGYNERFRTNGEDVDLSERIAALGYTTIYEPAALVNHLRQDTIRSILNTYWRYRSVGSAAYKTGRGLGVLAFNCYYFLRSGVRMCLRDIERRNFGLLWLDLCTPFYMAYNDIRRMRTPHIG